MPTYGAGNPYRHYLNYERYWHTEFLGCFREGQHTLRAEEIDKAIQRSLHQLIGQHGLLHLFQVTPLHIPLPDCTLVYLIIIAEKGPPDPDMYLETWEKQSIEQEPEEG